MRSAPEFCGRARSEGSKWWHGDPFGCKKVGFGVPWGSRPSQHTLRAGGGRAGGGRRAAGGLVGLPKSPQSLPKPSQSLPKGSQSLPKASPKLAKGSILLHLGSILAHLGAIIAPKASLLQTSPCVQPILALGFRFRFACLAYLAVSLLSFRVFRIAFFFKQQPKTV